MQLAVTLVSRSLGGRVATDSLQQKVHNETYEIKAYYDQNAHFFIFLVH